MSHFTNPGRGASGRQHPGSRFAGAVWTKLGWGHSRDHLYPDPNDGAAAVPPESTAGTLRGPSIFPGLSGMGARAGLNPDLPALSSSPCVGVAGRCGKFGDEPLTALPGGPLTARGAGEVFPGRQGLSRRWRHPLASVAGSRSQVTPHVTCSPVERPGQERGCPSRWRGEVPGRDGGERCPWQAQSCAPGWVTVGGRQLDLDSKRSWSHGWVRGSAPLGPGGVWAELCPQDRVWKKEGRDGGSCGDRAGAGASPKQLHPRRGG